MLIALLIGLGAGFLIVFGLQVKLQRDLRVFLSDAHLCAMAEAMGGLREAGAERSTFGGVAFSLAREGAETELWIRTTKKLPPACLSWVVAVASALSDSSPVAHRTDATHLRMVWRMSWHMDRRGNGQDACAEPDTADLSALRTAAADRLSETRITGP